MPTLNQIFPSKYLKASDLGENEVKVKIDHVDFEMLGEDKKAIVYFVGKKKGLVLNSTNGNTIAKLLGSDDTDNWPGGEITLYTTEVQFMDKMVEAIRVKLKSIAPKAKNGDARLRNVPPEPANDDWNDQDPPF